MIAWSIEVAAASGCFDRIIVSTEDDDIAAVALEWGAEVPFKRPAELADDFVGTTDVVGHATQWAIDHGWPMDAVCCIYATAPLIQVEDIKKGLALLESGNWKFVFAATPFVAPVHRGFLSCGEEGLEMLYPEHFFSRSQDLPECLHDAAQFYWGTPEAWTGKLRMFDTHSTIIKLPCWRVQDIDTEEDWQSAEWQFDRLRQTGLVITNF